MNRAISPAWFCSAVLLLPGSVFGCAACFGQSDSPMAAGMNWGIFTLLGTIVFVLGGVAGFFVFLARRSSAMAKVHEEKVSPSLDEKFLDGAELSNTLPLAARGGLGRVSALAQQRTRCARPQPESGKFLVSRGRK